MKPLLAACKLLPCQNPPPLNLPSLSLISSKKKKRESTNSLSIMSSSKPSKPHDIGFYIWILQVIIIVSLTTVVVWLCFHTNTPNFTVVGFDLPAFEARNSTFSPTIESTSTHLNTSLIIKLRISNPNRGMGIYYDDINVTLHHGNEVIGVSSIPSFYQGHRKSTQREVSVNGVEQFLQEYSRTVSVNERVNVSVGLMYSFRYRVFCLKSRHHSMDLQANVTVGSNGKLLEGMNVKLNHTSTQA